MNAIWTLLFVALACFSVSNSTAQEHGVDNDGITDVLVPLPSHWQRLRINEPIFNGLVHVVEVGQKHKETIVLIHGLGNSGLRDWLHVIPKLENNYHIIALDLPGFGESDPTSIQLAPLRYAQLLNWLIPQFSQEKVIVIGHSMGGAIGLRFAAQFPDKVKRLIMVDTAGVLHRSAFVRHMTKMPDRYQWLAKYQQRFNFVDSAVTKVNRFLNRISGSLLKQLDRLPDPTSVLIHNEFAQRYVYKDRPTLNAAIGLINSDFSEIINNFSIPTHIIWGEYDKVAPVRTGTLLQYHLDNAELNVIKGAGHVPMKDKPVEFMQKLNYALSQPPKAPLNNAPVENEHLATLTCDQQNHQSYSGRYAYVYIRGCQYITLTNLSAKHIFIENSDVIMQQLNVKSDNLAIEVNHSFVTMTNVRLQGKTAMKVKDSTVDAAGIQFVNSHVPIEVVADSLIYLSVSQHNQNGSVQYLHGISQGNQFDLK